MRSDVDVAVVGGGPVGLYLALALLHEGLRPRVYEKGPAAGRGGSRSIGVHPPSVELFDEIGLGHELLSRAVLVREGLAYGERGVVGGVSFDRCPAPHRFVATIEQWKTERILRDALLSRAPGCLVNDVEVIHARNDAEHATLALREHDAHIEEAAFAAVVAADGKRSVVRRALAGSFDGAHYDGEYAMADGPDSTSLGCAAAVFLNRVGLVESFPLPGRRRRWVMRRGREHASCEPPTRVEMCAILAERAGQTVDPALLEAPASFRAEHRIASALSVGRIVLVGDAAHIVSPIGGQGMNLGWMGARRVAAVLGAQLRAHRDPSDALARDARGRRALAAVAMRRAEMNMWLGRPTYFPRLRDAVVGTLLGLPTSHLLARAFTMRALQLGV